MPGGGGAPGRSKGRRMITSAANDDGIDDARAVARGAGVPRESGDAGRCRACELRAAPRSARLHRRDGPRARLRRQGVETTVRAGRVSAEGDRADLAARARAAEMV